MAKKVISTGKKAGAAGASQAPRAGGDEPSLIEGWAALAVQPGAGDGAADEEEGGEAVFDPEAARRSFEALRGELEGLDDDEVVALRIDVQRVAAVSLSVAQRDLAPERRAKFERLAEAGYYDIANLERLSALAEGAWHVRRQQQRLLFSASGAAVSEDDVATAYELRARMMRVLEHWLGDRHDIAVDLRQLREGSGYQDLANDLQTLGEIYVRSDVFPIIERDTAHYRPADPADAFRFARVIMASLGVGKEGEAKRLTALVQRSATLLLRAYEEHRNRGQFLFQGVEDVASTYPSIYAAARNPRRKRAPGEAPPGDEGPGDERPNEAPVAGV